MFNSSKFGKIEYILAGVLELVYRIVSKTIAHTGLGVRVPSPVKFEKPLFMGGFLNFTGKKANYLIFS